MATPIIQTTDTISVPSADDPNTGKLPGFEDPEQLSLLEVEPDWRIHWRGMPEFEQRDLEPWSSLTVHFACRRDRNDFAKLIGQTITDDTRSVWVPKAEIGRYVDKRFATPEAPVLPRFPIYIISKGRWESRLTAKSLEAIAVPYRIVVEPQERDNYAAVIDPDKILVLPFSNLGQGSIPARNWVWQHAVAEGHKRHWILDDNINGFYRLHNNLKTPVHTGATFAAAEDFVERYDNVGLAAFNYFMFAPRKSASIRPFTLNTRCYSCILINHDLTGGLGLNRAGIEGRLEERWRGRYNEDTDLSLRALKAGWCTVLFNAFLAWKMTTMTMGGGNTEALYKLAPGEKDGRLQMAESLKEQHPETEIVWKWGRWQHSYNYRVFNQPLRLRHGVSVPDQPNNYGMRLQLLNAEGQPFPPEPND